jgi:hypothetical protein
MSSRNDPGEGEAAWITWETFKKNKSPWRSVDALRGKGLFRKNI